LVNGDGGVDTTALTEEGSDSSARSLRGNKDDIDIGWDLNLGKVLEDRGETVGEVESLSWLTGKHTFLRLTYLSLGQLRLDRRPCLALSSI
jgi:hypothetical protein